MFRHTLILTLTACLALAHSLPRNRKSDAEAEAAKNAHYFFSSDVEDQVNDLTQHREEVRDGLKVRGSFSYSDGFLRRHVVYEADQDGYRVIQDKIEPLPGPKINPEGRTLVRAEVGGTEKH